MKQLLFTLFIISTLGLFSCRKDKFQLTIKQYDSTQIANYIAAHNLTGFVKDTVGGDTSGIWYKIITPGTGHAMAYSDLVPFVFTVQTVDGTYVKTDTIINHFYDYLGHVSANGYNSDLTPGLQTAIKNDLIFVGGSMRVIVPSRLAYGHYGKGQGSSQVGNNRIAGNECLDYYVHVIDNVADYDDKSINKYMTDSSLMGYTKVESILYPKNYYYYKVLTPGTGTDYLTENSTVTAVYDGLLLNGTNFGNYHGSGGQSFFVGTLTQGVKEALIKGALLNTKIDIIAPSVLEYGLSGSTGIPAFSCLRFSFVVDAVTP